MKTLEEVLEQLEISDEGPDDAIDAMTDADFDLLAADAYSARFDPTTDERVTRWAEDRDAKSTIALAEAEAEAKQRLREQIAQFELQVREMEVTQGARSEFGEASRRMWLQEALKVLKGMDPATAARIVGLKKFLFSKRRKSHSHHVGSSRKNGGAA